MRERAEKKVQKAKLKDHMSENSAELVHELKIHQAELEMQNEELRYSQEEYAELYNKYLELYNDVPIGYLTLDMHGIIRNVNDKGFELLQTRKENIIGRGFSRFIPKAEEWKYYHALANTIDTRENQELELQLKRDEGLFDAHLELISVFDRNGSKYRIIITDITERKKAEEALRKQEEQYRLQLQKEVNERTKELKRSNEELQRFAYVASHDLQEPLRTIASFTQLLERRYKGKFDSDADEFMDFIVEAAVRMKAQIEGLLEYSRVETKGEEFKPVNTGEILKETIKRIYTQIKESDAEITYDKLPVVIGDGEQLQRVFQNLISNAIRFRKCEEQLKIHISAIKSEDDYEYVFSVQDNGIGIEEQYMERIFVIFQRLHTRNVYHGTGMGLSIVKRVIERHGGCVWVESEFGVGSIFHFTLPINA